MGHCTIRCYIYISIYTKGLLSFLNFLPPLCIICTAAHSLPLFTFSFTFSSFFATMATGVLGIFAFFFLSLSFSLLLPSFSISISLRTEGHGWLWGLKKEGGILFYPFKNE